MPTVNGKREESPIMGASETPMGTTEAVNSKGKPGFTITGGKGFHVTFENGWTISVQLGPGNYCGNYHMDITEFYKDTRRELPRSSTAEIAYWGPDGKMCEFLPAEYPDTVKGYVVPAKVLALMLDISSRPSEAADGPTPRSPAKAPASPREGH